MYSIKKWVLKMENNIVGHFNGYVKFECNDWYHCIRKTILNGDNLLVYDN